MSNTVIAIVTAIVTGGVFTFLQYLISRNDNRDEEKKKTEEWRQKVDGDLAEGKLTDKRLELLLLMYITPDSEAEILTVADKYFRELKGDYYMTPLFQKWLIKHHMEIPAWFSGD